MNDSDRYSAVVIGASAGGMALIKALVSALPENFSLPVIIVQHIAESSDIWVNLLDGMANITVKEADEKERIVSGTVYIAPANYHLLIEKDHTITLTVDERVNYARPSIDVLFETAADAYKGGLIGIVLSGSNSDGAKGLRYIKEKGGLTIVQDPATAEVPSMPSVAAQVTQPDYILSPSSINALLVKIHNRQSAAHEYEN